MNWHSWSEFIAMGGYGLYVWGSVLVVAAGIVGELLTLRERRKAAVHDLAAVSTFSAPQ